MRVIISIILFSLCAFIGKTQNYFEDMTTQSGINHAHIAPNLMGGGIAVIDFDNDGWEDIYFTGGVYEDKLFKNNGDGTFTSVGTGLGIYDITRVTQTTAVTTGDIDNDGWEDIFVSTEAGQPSILWHNEHGNGFINISENANINDLFWSMGAAMADVNLDGFLDIYSINYIKEAKPLLDDGGSIVGFDHDCFPNTLYINKGDNTFEEMAAEYGVDSKGCGLAVTITDINSDTKPDIYIANDFGKWIVPNQYFENQYPIPNFEDKAAALGLNTELYGMGISTGDINSDGLLDYYITNLGKNALLKKKLDGSFENITDYGSVGNEKTGGFNSTGWGTQLFDVDHDGDQDLFVANGYIGAAPFLQTTFEDPNKLYINDGLGKFTDVSDIQGMSDISISRGSATLDYDNDGDLDLVTVNIGSVRTLDTNVKLYDNLIGNNRNWLKVKLEGSASNRPGYGAKVQAYSGEKLFIEEVFGGGSHGSKSTSIAHFGLNDITELDSLIIDWPGGNKQQFKHIETNQFIKIREGKSEMGIIGCMDSNNENYNNFATVSAGCLVGKTITSLENKYEVNTIGVYPIPSYKKIKLVGVIKYPVKAQIINSNGKQLKRTEVISDHQSIDISELPGGIYFLRIDAGRMAKIIKVD